MFLNGHPSQNWISSLLLNFNNLTETGDSQYDLTTNHLYNLVVFFFINFILTIWVNMDLNEMVNYCYTIEAAQDIQQRNDGIIKKICSSMPEPHFSDSTKNYVLAVWKTDTVLLKNFKKFKH